VGKKKKRRREPEEKRTGRRVRRVRIWCKWGGCGHVLGEEDLHQKSSGIVPKLSFITRAR
jgi:hypothetical protein